MSDTSSQATETETNVMTTWPTIGATAVGRLVGSLCSVRIGLGRYFTIGRLMALATVPFTLVVFAWQLCPFVCRRYTITSRRIVIQKGYSATDSESVSLGSFDAIDIEVLPGQASLHSGELLFRRGDEELLRLSGVSRPEVFRQICLETHSAKVAVVNVLKAQASTA